MSDKMKILNIEDITIGERWRKDLGDMEDLVASITEKGILQPITVRANLEDKGYTLMAGGRRITAAVKAGLTKIPALIRDQSDVADAEIDLREVELLENIHRKDFTWVEQTNLIAEIDRLQKSKDPSWSQNNTAKLLGHKHAMNVSRAIQLSEDLKALPELAQCKTQDEAIKMVKKAEEKIITAELRRRQDEVKDTGMRDVLKLAENNYQVKDALVAMKALPAGAGNLHLIEVDPPYGIDLNAQKKQGGDLAASYHEVPTDEYPQFLKTVAEETFRIAARDCWMIFWYGPTHHQLVLTTLRAAGWEVDEIPAIWTKPNGQTLAPEVYLARGYEPFFVCRKGRPALNNRGRLNVFNFAPVAANKKYHPTERPVDLIEEILNTFVGIGARVFIPFLGSGATLRAVYNLGGTGWGYDLNAQYKDFFMLAVQRDTEKLNASEEE